MSEEQLKAFLKKVKTDTSLQEKLKGAADADAAITIAKEAGFNISSDDLKNAQSTELSEEELEGVAGGCQVNSAQLSFPPYCEFPIHR
jgi:predicted ribosomally synthesized peptide with nif11-like leader